MKLRWTDADATTDGRYTINSEKIRGEPRYYWIDKHPPLPRWMEKPDGSFEKRTVKRRAQKIEDAIVQDMEHGRPRWCGTPTGYVNHNCRCADCTKAWRIRQLAYMHSHPEQQEKKRERARVRWAQRKAQRGDNSVST